MTIRTLTLLAPALLLAGCDDQREAPVREEQPPQNNEVKAKQSVMRPSVIAEAELPAEKAPEAPRRATISFGEDSEALSPEGAALLDRLVTPELLAGGAAITIRGHSDTRGGDRVNRAASLKRAEAVADYLEVRGIARDRMAIIALGETRPVAPNAKPDGSDFPEGRARNRRVEVEIAPAPAPQAAPEAPAEANRSEAP